MFSYFPFPILFKLSFALLAPFPSPLLSWPNYKCYWYSRLMYSTFRLFYRLCAKQSCCVASLLFFCFFYSSFTCAPPTYHCRLCLLPLLLHICSTYSAYLPIIPQPHGTVYAGPSRQPSPGCFAALLGASAEAANTTWSRTRSSSGKWKCFAS